jgi:hypothetical protein
MVCKAQKGAPVTGAPFAFGCSYVRDRSPILVPSARGADDEQL